VLRLLISRGLQKDVFQLRGQRLRRGPSSLFV
jgi:hypothetical protein